MKYLVLIIFLTLSTNLLAIDPQAIIRKSEDMYKGNTSMGTFTMVVKTPEYTRSVKMRSWNDGNDKALIITIEPKKEEGNKLLKIKNEIWSYLKNTETTMKLPASMMLQAWNGSDLTYDDLVRESSAADDYDIKYLQDEKIGTELCWKFELKPKRDAAVVWGKIYYWIRQGDNLPALMQYYDENGQKHRTMKFEKIMKMGGRTIPTVWTVINDRKEGDTTQFIYDDVKFDIDLPAKIFSFRELEK